MFYMRDCASDLGRFRLVALPKPLRRLARREPRIASRRCEAQCFRAGPRPRLGRSLRQSYEGRSPGNPKVPPAVIHQTFQRMVAEYGHYPPDSDLADELAVSKRTIVNWRVRGYLPARSTQ
jgi:hypothetical protein